jgi:vesicle coat complex subunit
VRASGLSALARLGTLNAGDLAAALADRDAEVRRRACDLSGRHHFTALSQQLVDALADDDPGVVEAASCALGEIWEESGEPRGLAGQPDDRASAVHALQRTALGHPDPLSRESAVAALGALGDPAGLPAVLSALQDKPAVRRRAVIALAAFDGPAVADALERAASDKDWQVRQMAEDLLGRRPRPKPA